MLSEHAKERLWTMFAASSILQRFVLPGMFGLAFVGVGIWSVALDRRPDPRRTDRLVLRAHHGRVSDHSSF